MESDYRVCSDEEDYKGCEEYIATENPFCIEDSHPQQSDLSNSGSSAEEDS